MPSNLLEELQRGPFELKEGLHRAMQVAAGMEYIHHLGVLHCDIAARNVLVSTNGTLKISDFGLARIDGSPECDFSSKRVRCMHAYIHA